MRVFLQFRHLASLTNNNCFSSGKSKSGLDIPLDSDFIEKGELVILLYCLLLGIFLLLNDGISVCSVTDAYNESLVFSPDDRRLFYSIREPIVNRVFSSSRQRGFASKSVNVPQSQNKSQRRVKTLEK